MQRAFGILTHARILPRGEFYQMYSNLRLGATMGLLPLSVQKVDEVLDQAQDAHLCIYAGETLSGQALDAARADRVRELLGEKFPYDSFSKLIFGSNLIFRVAGGIAAAAAKSLH